MIRITPRPPRKPRTARGPARDYTPLAMYAVILLGVIALVIVVTVLGGPRP